MYDGRKIDERQSESEIRNIGRLESVAAMRRWRNSSFWEYGHIGQVIPWRHAKLACMPKLVLPKQPILYQKENIGEVDSTH
jgi:hypothetical protein